MITKISIENFKGVRERIEIPVGPITLLFGANSAGKSTVLHALHFAREVLVRRNLDVDRTESGGDHIDLGGFRNLLHKHDTSQAVRLEFSLDLSERDVPTFSDAATPVRESDLSALIELADVALEIAWSESRLAPFVRSYAIAINGKALATIRCDGKPSSHVHLSDINVQHPVLLNRDDSDYSVIDPILELSGTASAETMNPSILLAEMTDALPTWHEPLPLPFKRYTPPTIGHQQSLFEHTNQPFLPFDEDELAMGDAIDVLSQLVVGPGELLADYLQQFRYVGPLRATPPRNYSPPRYPDESRWADGMAAWDELSRDTSLTQKVSDWLSNKERLDAGCSLIVQRFRLLDETSELFRVLASGSSFDNADADELAHGVLDLLVEQRLIVLSDSGEMLPQDVGVGISQLLPVVVALLSSDNRPIGIEQPELHVHPRLQAEIADVLIEASKEPMDKQLFIETHSEHLILRLLRRIRETTDKELPSWHSGLNCDQLSVVYLEGGESPTKAVSLRVTSDGDFADRWPNGFFEERAEELF